MITQLSLQEQIDLIRKKEVKVEELFQEYLTNIDKLNPRLNAIVSLRDRDWIIKKAQEKDSLKQDIKIKQILFGLPLATKELFDVKELPTTYGMPEYQNAFPQNDSLIIKNLKQQGATIIGKSNMAELAIGSHTKNKLFKSSSNPYDLSLSPGGSSGGASAAAEDNGKTLVIFKGAGTIRIDGDGTTTQGFGPTILAPYAHVVLNGDSSGGEQTPSGPRSHSPVTPAEEREGLVGAQVLDHVLAEHGLKTAIIKRQPRRIERIPTQRRGSQQVAPSQRRANGGTHASGCIRARDGVRIQFVAP